MKFLKINVRPLRSFVDQQNVKEFFQRYMTYNEKLLHDISKTSIIKERTINMTLSYTFLLNLIFREFKLNLM